MGTRQYTQVGLLLLLVFVAPAAASSSGDDSLDLNILFFACALIIGCLLRTIIKRYHVPIPYTVFMLITGMLFGLGLVDGDNDLGKFGNASIKYANMDPHLFLTIFLPALIFESASMVHFHTFWREKFQALVLAGPGVILCSGLSAVVAKYFFDYDWTWYESFMFGSAISATDPVAVVALLRELGASKILATLIEAESLLNDGTSFVFFLIFKDFVDKTHERTVWQVFRFFARLSLGGVALGLAFAIPFIFFIRRVYNDAMVETSLTIATCYVTFWTAESPSTEVHVSGVLAVVALGIMFARYKTSVTPSVEENLHHVWETISFLANTVVFLMSGIIVSSKALSTEDIRWVDAGYNIMLYVLIHLIRGGAIALFVLLHRFCDMGYGMDWKTGLVLTWGGLRGAIGLALALIVDLDDGIPQATRDLFVFHVCGIVFLTLCINGTSMKYLLRALGMTQSRRETLQIYMDTLKVVRQRARNLIHGLKEDELYTSAQLDWDEVLKLTPRYEKTVPAKELARYEKRIAKRTQEHEAAKKAAAEKPIVSEDAKDNVMIDPVTGAVVVNGTGVTAPDGTLVVPVAGGAGGHNPNLPISAVNLPGPGVAGVVPRPPTSTAQFEGAGPTLLRTGTCLDLLDSETMRNELERRFCNVMLKGYEEYYEEGFLSREGFSMLEDSVDTALDHDANQFAEHWRLVESYTRIPRWLTWLNSSCFGSCLRCMSATDLVYDRVERAAEIITTVLRALNEKMAELNHEMADFHDIANFCVMEDIVNLIRRKARTAWLDLVESYPEAYKSVQTKHAAVHLTTQQIAFIEEYAELGLLEEKERGQLIQQARQGLFRLEHYRPPCVIVSPEESLTRMPFITLLPQNVRADVMHHSKMKFYNRGDIIVEQGSFAFRIICITRGVVSSERCSALVVDARRPGGGRHAQLNQIADTMGRRGSLTLMYQQRRAAAVINDTDDEEDDTEFGLRRSTTLPADNAEPDALPLTTHYSVAGRPSLASARSSNSHKVPDFLAEINRESESDSGSRSDDDDEKDRVPTVESAQGSLIGAYSMMTGRPIPTTSRSRTIVEAMAIPRESVYKMIKCNRRVKQSLWRLAGAQMMRTMFCDHLMADPAAARELCHRAKFHLVPDGGRLIKLKVDMLLLSGACVCSVAHVRQKIFAPAFLPVKLGMVRFVGRSQLLEMPPLLAKADGTIPMREGKMPSLAPQLHSRRSSLMPSRVRAGSLAARRASVLNPLLMSFNAELATDAERTQGLPRKSSKFAHSADFDESDTSEEEDDMFQRIRGGKQPTVAPPVVAVVVPPRMVSVTDTGTPQIATSSSRYGAPPEVPGAPYDYGSPSPPAVMQPISHMEQGSLARGGQGVEMMPVNTSSEQPVVGGWAAALSSVLDSPEVRGRHLQ